MMARPLRMEYPGAHDHVMSRGNKRRPIVREGCSFPGYHNPQRTFAWTPYE